MNLSPAYLKQREEWKQEGTLEGQLSLITSLLEGRFGSLDAELSGLVERIAQLPISERTGLLLSLANLSRSELLERFRENYTFNPNLKNRQLKLPMNNHSSMSCLFC